MIEEINIRALFVIGAVVATHPLTEQDNEWQMTEFTIAQWQRALIVIGYSIPAFLIPSSYMIPYAALLLMPLALRYSILGPKLFGSTKRE
jgi:hypothetical protein